MQPASVIMSSKVPYTSMFGHQLSLFYGHSPPENLAYSYSYEESFWIFCENFVKFHDMLKMALLELYSSVYCPEYFGLHFVYFCAREYDLIVDMIITLAVDPALSLFG